MYNILNINKGMNFIEGFDVSTLEYVYYDEKGNEVYRTDMINWNNSMTNQDKDIYRNLIKRIYELEEELNNFKSIKNQLN